MSGGLLRAAAGAMTISVAAALLLMFAGFAALVFIHVRVVGRVFSRGLVAIATPPGRGCGGVGSGLPPEELEELPCYRHGGGASADCVVCLEAFQAGDRCRRLPPCGHGFHARCVDAWLLRSAACPICRRRPTASGAPPAGAERWRLELR